MALQEIGLKAIMDIGGFRRNVSMYQKALRDMEKQTGNTAKTMTDSGKRMENAMAKGSASVTSSVEAMGHAFSDLTQIQLSDEQINQINKLVEAGMTVEEAYKQVTAETRQMTAGTEQMTAAAGTAGLGIGQLAIALGAVTAAFSAAVAFARSAIAQFTELGLETYKLSLELGTAAEETSALLSVSRHLDVSASSLTSTFGIFAKKLYDLKAGMAEGKEADTAFTRALEELNVPMYDAMGNVRDMNDLLPEIADRISEMGAGLETTGLVMDLFGRSGRDLLPVLMEGGDALRGMEQRAADLGATMSTTDVAAVRDYKKSSEDLADAWRGLKDVIARELGPAVQWLTEQLTITTNAARQALVIEIAIAAGWAKLVTTGDLAAATTAALGAAAKATGQAFDTATSQGLDPWLANLQAMRQQEEADVAAQQAFTEQLTDIARQYARRMIDININMNRQLEDMGTTHQRRMADLMLSELRRSQDVARDTARRQADIAADYSTKLQDLERQRVQQIEQVQSQHRRRQLDLEEQYQERLRDIQLNFADAADEALRSRDAVALLRAMRDRARGLRDAEHDRVKRQQDEEENYQEQLQQAAATHAERIRQAQEAYRRQQEDLRLSLRRQQEDRAIAYQRQLQDLALAEARQREDLQRNYARQQEDLRRNLLQSAGLWEQYISGTNAQLTAFVNMLNMAGQASLAFFRIQQMLGTLGKLGVPVPALPAFGMQHGGAGTVTQPTLFMAGERGPERFAFAPVGISGAVRFDVHVQHSGNAGSWIGPTLDQFDAAVNDKLIRLAKILRGG